ARRRPSIVEGQGTGTLADAAPALVAWPIRRTRLEFSNCPPEFTSKAMIGATRFPGMVLNVVMLVHPLRLGLVWRPVDWSRRKVLAAVPAPNRHRRSGSHRSGWSDRWPHREPGW